MTQYTGSGDSSRTVIFVGGTSYSGSTLLDMILGNDPAGFSCGEVLAVFYPYRRHHLQLEELSQTVDWRAIKASGPQNLYLNLFTRFPQTRFIVDSSKSPLWISERTAELHSRGIRTKHILIWKSPAEFLESRRKRGQEQSWERAWVNYHRYYFTRIDSWKSVRYRDLVTDSATLERLCKILEIPYFPGKERYWNREQHSVFGNDSARIHLYDESTNSHTNVRQAITRSMVDGVELPQHRTVAYKMAAESESGNETEAMKEIRYILERHDIASPSVNCEDERQLLTSLRTDPVYHAFEIVKLKYGANFILDVLRRARRKYSRTHTVVLP